MRRIVLGFIAIALAASAGGAGWKALELDGELGELAAPAAAAANPAELTSTRTDLLSARRVPEWLQTPTADALLSAQLARIIADSPTDTCLVVRHEGRVVFAHNADLPLVPASTTKIVTGVAALEVLGPDTQLRTSVVAAAAPASGVVTGDLWLVGGGDPIVTTADYAARYDEPQLHTDLATLADAVVAAGVREVRGSIVGDESRYDTQRTVPTWDPVFIRDNESGPLSALSVNDGFASYPRTRHNVPAVPAADPAANSAQLFAQLLTARGVLVADGTGSGRAPAGVVEVAAVDSAPVAEVVGQMLAASDNTTAELLVKELGVATGGEGSTAAGVRAAIEVLRADGVNVDGIVLNDGSGLDRGDRLTCNALTAMLDDAGPTSPLANGLAVAAERGTLRERWTGTEAAGRIRAKTGSVRNSRALAGFADSASGPLTFAYIANAAPTIDAAANIAVQDRLGLEMVRYPQGPSLDQLGPQPVP